MPPASDSDSVFPSAPVWGAEGLDRARASHALDVLADAIGGRNPQPSSFAGHMREEKDALLDMLERRHYFGSVTPLANLGRVQEVKIGDLIRIAVFVASVRMAGVESTHINEVRELAVKAIRG